MDLVARYYDPQNAAQTWTFVGVTSGRSADLSELAHVHAPLLRDLTQYLLVIAPLR